MNWHRRLAAFLMVVLLVGCVRAVDGQGQAPYAPYSHDDRPDTHDGSDGGGGGNM
jgi:hypothetical protein